MADPKHLTILRRSVEAWNEWRKVDHTRPDLTNADLTNADLTLAKLINADLRGADLTRANLVDANLHAADLRDATLRNANLIRANLASSDLRGADLRGARLFDADLTFANLVGATLTDADLKRATLTGADFSDANLRGADLTRADLTHAKLIRADLRGADLTAARLIDAILNAADLTDAHLWETQRGGWSIKGVICKQAFWDRPGKEPTEYNEGAFERAHAQQFQITLSYPGGMSPIELAMLPLIVEQLQTEHEGSILHIRSVLDEGRGATVTITVEDTLSRSDEAIQRECEVLKNKLEGAKRAFQEKATNIAKLKTQLDQFKLDTWHLLMSQVQKNAERKVHEEISAAVLFLDLKGFSKMNKIEAEEAVQIVRSHAASLLKRRNGQHPNTWGDAVMAAFENPNDGLECAYKLVRHLEVDDLVARIGMSYGELTISYNEVREALDIDGPAMSEGARLEPMAEPGEVLISKILRYHPDVDEERFTFCEQRRALRKGVGIHKKGKQIECYSVKSAQITNS